jgi:hypothetical protein
VTIASSPKLTRLAKNVVAPAKAGAYHVCLARSTGAIGPSLRWGDELPNYRENHLIPVIRKPRDARCTAAGFIGAALRLLPAFQDLVWRSVAVCPHADVGNHAFARSFSALKGRAAQMGQ